MLFTIKRSACAPRGCQLVTTAKTEIMKRPETSLEKKGDNIATKEGLLGCPEGHVTQQKYEDGGLSVKRLLQKLQQAHSVVLNSFRLELPTFAKW